MIKNSCIIFCVMCLLVCCGEQTSINLTNLRCELLTNPQGIDCATPRLSWEIVSEGRGIRQKGYRILASCPKIVTATGVGRPNRLN